MPAARLNLRAVLRDGNPWFVAKDVCDALGFDGPASNATSYLDTDERVTLTKGQVNDPSLLALFPGRMSAVTLVNESGLYSLILRSRKPEARAFKKWVTAEVLPAIRKSGMFLTAPVAQQASEDPDAFLARALVVATQTLEKAKLKAESATRC